tara:strand:- start:456 stop:2174 length:1719 start_codon:yes stop_codon:yes gene_type:complete
MKNNTKYIIVTGGVLSGLGKGVLSASIGSILTMMGFKISIKKLDPYLNVDPGTLNPVEHGEVFVTDDGTETDLDLGYYERFNGIITNSSNSTSSGKIFKNLLEKERKGDFLGKTVQMIPHFTNEIKNFIYKDSIEYDIIICEIGGSIGDIEAMPFYESLRQLKCEVGNSNFLLVHLTYIVYYEITNELKTKPSQNAIRELMKTGLIPDVLACRHERKMDDSTINKLKQFCSHILDIPNIDSIYKLPLMLYNQNLPIFLSEHFDLKQEIIIDTSKWTYIENKINSTSKSNKEPLVVAIVGKYVQLHDAYCSLLESIYHASIQLNISIKYEWIDCRNIETNNNEAKRKELLDSKLNNVDCLIIPGGFGKIGIETIIDTIHLARIRNIPTFGICLGLQAMVIEWIRNEVGIKDAISEEWIELDNPQHKENKTVVIGLLKDQVSKQLGGTMNLGSYDIHISKNSKTYKIYGNKDIIKERHRHRYEVLPEYKSCLENSGMIISGNRNQNNIVEIIELCSDKNRWYIGCQFHPEYKSSIFEPHPLILDWLKTALFFKKRYEIAIINNGRSPIKFGNFL